MDNNTLDFFFKCRKALLQKLNISGIISDKLREEFSDVFTFFNVEKEPTDTSNSKLNEKFSDVNKIEKESNDSYSVPKDSFAIYVRGYDSQKTIEELITNFDAKSTVVPHMIQIKLEHIDELIIGYRNKSSIQWDRIVEQTNINWSLEFVTKYNSLWDWHYLQRNPSFKLSFELIEANKDFVKWDFTGYSSELNWTPFYLNKYKVNLNFNDLSRSSRIKWDEHLINSVKDSWNWEILCSNEYIKWDVNLVEKFEDRIDFKALMKNKCFEWDERIIDKYLDKWDWESLSTEQSLKWTDRLIEKYKNKWTWNLGFYNSYYFNERNCPSLSSNNRIKWNKTLLKKFESKLDFWLIALQGFIEDNAIVEFHDKFNVNKRVDFQWAHYDWGSTIALLSRSNIFELDKMKSYPEAIYRTGWENFSLNPNFFVSKQNITFYFHYRVSITKPFYDESTGAIGYITTQPRLLQIFKNSPVTGINFEDLLENQDYWTSCLVNDLEINDSIWSEILKPIFTGEFTLVFLEELRKYYLR
ncbi:MAG: hypothetical protein ABI723_22990 [Bacteroidia bacterium]